ncbi:MAG TPA: ATP-binding protein [Dehalococcoidia bacterium]|nr:ATP-binding protein [Dehalococcoidia bacterium]
MQSASFREKRAEYERAINTAFSPHSPINEARFFAGRTEQVRAVVDTIQTPGLHAAIYGERGVGKTSLANIIKDYLGGQIVGVSRVNCSQQDTFESVIRRSLSAFQLSMSHPLIGFGQREESTVREVLELLPQDGTTLSPDAVAALLAQLPPHFVLVIDEFDRLPREETAAFADFIKSLSDRGASSTVVLVGVAEDIDALILSHASVERCLRQIPLQRMSEDELSEIIDRGLEATGFALASDAPRKRILSVSQGFPHYTHLLAQHAARTALDSERTTIEDEDVVAGMKTAVERADQSHRELYYKATTGTKKRNLWREVVAACALADTDERGYFSTRAVQDRLSEILGRHIIQQTLAYHLGKLTEDNRGPLLQRVGPERRYRYRFLNPLMRPFITMKAMNDGLIHPQ